MRIKEGQLYANQKADTPRIITDMLLIENDSIQYTVDFFFFRNGLNLVRGYKSPLAGELADLKWQDVCSEIEQLGRSFLSVAGSFTSRRRTDIQTAKLR